METGFRRCLRRVGWTLVAIGGGALAGSLVTDVAADASHGRAQQELRERWTDDTARAATSRGIVEDPVVRMPQDEAAPADRGPDRQDASSGPPDPRGAPSEAGEGDPVGLLWFERDGDRVVTTDELVVLSGVSQEVLARAPGWYPNSAPPGGSGTLAIAGHRTTHGAPFDALDHLRSGDTVHVVDPHGTEWVYRFRESLIVDPADIWVVGSDPLGTGEATLALTTCHPRHSAQQRLVVFAVLDRSVAGSDELARPRVTSDGVR